MKSTAAEYNRCQAYKYSSSLLRGLSRCGTVDEVITRLCRVDVSIQLFKLISYETYQDDLRVDHCFISLMVFCAHFNLGYYRDVLHSRCNARMPRAPKRCRAAAWRAVKAMGFARCHARSFFGSGLSKKQRWFYEKYMSCYRQNGASWSFQGMFFWSWVPLRDFRGFWLKWIIFNNLWVPLMLRHPFSILKDWWHIGDISTLSEVYFFQPIHWHKFGAGFCY